MALRLVHSGIAAGTTELTGTEVYQPWSYFLSGDTVAGSGVIDAAGGHLQVVESAPAAMTVAVKAGAVLIRDNNATEFLKKTYLGIVEADADGQGLVVTANSSGANRIDAVVAYVKLDAATAVQGLNQFQLEVVAGSGVAALTDGALQTAVDALVAGYTDVPFLRLADLTVANGASSIVNANIADTRTQIERHNNNGGWIRSKYTATRTGNHVFTLPVDATGIIGKGTRIKYKESGAAAEYGVVISASEAAGVTTVTLATNTDYTMSANPVDGLWYSNENPHDYPDRFSFTSVATGFSSAPATAASFTVVGKRVTVSIQHTEDGTSNATSFTVPLPIGTANGDSWGNVPFSVDNGSTLTSGGIWRVSNSGSSCALYANYTTSSNWTASGGKRARFTFDYIMN